ncbi:apoptosis-inducing factor 2-like [Cocos nucifera]|uniref:Apoptosis-inducing factor 2-like n=1 Tax=Cocos nucifera TaxID=13894 RepID=A0A8K0MVF0_COCNU|nr:apoptosis-inducing factor 2-like [Cocos nucifera]
MTGVGLYERRKVVVVGGGVAGALLAKTIQSYAEVVLIDPKEYFEIPWANLRSKVEPSVAEKTIINHSDYFVHGKIITSSATNVTETEVVTAEGRKVAYTHLVIATGHAAYTPRCRRDRLEQFQEENTKIKISGSILIIGGGPMGVELAAEIAVDYPEKKVTIVHSGPRLLEFIGRRAANKTLHWLKSKKVEVHLDQSVDIDSISEADRVFKTSAGETITADCYFYCVDQPVSSSWLQNSLLKDCINKNGRLMVDEHLRVKGQKNIFAIGDITDVPEIKQGFLAQRHAIVVAKNLKLLINGAKESRLAKYKPATTMAMVSLGRKDAVAQFSFVAMIGFLPGFIKSKDLFVHRTRQQMGLDRGHPSLI